MTRAARLWLLLGVLVGLAVCAVLLARDVQALEPLLSSAQANLETAQAAVEDGDQTTAGAALEDADQAVAAARVRADGPLWAAAGWVPRYGASARAVQQGVELADATTQLASTAIDQALSLVADGAAAFVGPGGQVRTDALVAAAESLEQLPLDDVVDARDALADLPESGLIGPTSPARAAAVERATAVIEQVERGRTGARTFASFLGAEGERTYLLAVQNPGELRGTGGLISYLAELTVVDGRIDVRESADEGLVEDVIARSGRAIGFDVDDPVDRSPDFAARYDVNAGGSIIQSVNLDPDLPTVGPVLLDLYEARTGRAVDGAVLTDPFALEEILGATGGPLDVPAAALAEAPGLPTQLTEENTARTLLIDVYDEFGGLNPARREFDEAVTLAVLQRLTSGAWEPPVLARAMGEAAASRRVQLYSADPDEQAGFATLGIGGSMTDPASTVDVLAVTGVNAGPDKSDAHIAHRLTAEIELRARPGAVPWQVLRDTTVTVAVDNPLRPDEHDDYIIGTNEPVPVGSGASPRVQDALNRTWFTIWTPMTTRLTSLRDGVQDQVLRTDSIHGHNTIDYFLETPSASTASFSAPFTGPLELRRVGGRHLYELVLWRQAKAVPDAWDVSVTPPDGLRVDAVTVEGGGPTHTGLGVAEPQPLQAVVEEDGRVRLRGTVTRDTVLRVWFVTE